MSKLEELKQKNQEALAPGGTSAIEAQHKAGKKTARERISTLLDSGSFVEIDKFVKKTYVTPGFESASEVGEAVVCGYGTIDERPVFIFSQDYTVLSGSLSVAHAQKILKAIDMAAKNGVPVIGIIDSDGARITEGIAAIDSYAAIIKRINDISGVIPTITVVAGNCIGTAAYIGASTDFCFMIDGISCTALRGPQIYASTLGDAINVKTAFSAKAHNENTGISQFMSSTEDECYDQVKKLLAYLPSNNLEASPYVVFSDDLNRQIAGFDEAYDAKALIAAVADGHEVLEYQAGYSPEIATMFGRINGTAVGFVANGVDGVISGHAARKAARFIGILDAYNIPLITFTNCGGTTIEQEKDMLIANIARLMSAYAQAGVPKVNVVVGKAIGDGFAMMCPKSLGADMVFAWPQAEITALPSEAGAILFYEDEIAKAKDGVAAKAEMIQKYIEEYANPWQAASQGVIDDVIEPAHTRQMIISALEMCIAKREEQLPRKHGVLPL